MPDEISQILGCAPTLGYIKGQTYTTKGRPVVRKTGAWHLDATPQEPANLDAQVAELFTRVNQDLAVWERLSSKYRIDLFCGFFMNEDDEGLVVSADTLKVLGDRGIKLSLCLYPP